jgi:hypothetical protein
LLFRFHFNGTWNFVVILIKFLVKQINIDFYNDFPMYIIVYILCSIKSNEMNCNIVSRFSYIIY